MKGQMRSGLAPALLTLLLVGLLAGCGGSDDPQANVSNPAGQESKSGSGRQLAKEYQDANKALAEIEVRLKLLTDAPTVDESDSDSF